MGQFSWIYSDTNKQVIDGKIADTYLLVPEPFHEKYGKEIYESCYDGYGHFGEEGHDVYVLVAEWNKECIPEILRRIKNGTWRCPTTPSDAANLKAFYEDKPFSCEHRHLGIIMSCYDEDNFALEYPIKITSTPMNYREASPSISDPDQGWEMDNED